ncbi:acetylcholine receptor subunit alpha-L1-like [Diorhabda sublineata]|uniref:acetylcholine receptor subunit alpha-L1-like n=1 Tax=Diorhabda sublineata TaxID=1163346 RepID=UPI0024E107FB|nr:acetylcholine receptor subunit alpha-L1-like [Diorhabda sublineata]
MIIYLSIFLLFHFIVCANSGFTTTKLGPQPIWNATHTDQLRHDLLLNYDKFSRPAQHYNVTTVRFGMVIRHIEFNEFKSTLTVYAWLRMVWNDEKLKWDPSNYGNLSTLHLAEHELWQPDIYLYNSATSTAVNQFGNTHFLVYPDGKVLWVPPTQLTVLCGLDLKNWPFDKQECYMKFGSWTYSGDQIDLLHYDDNPEVGLELIIHNSEWEITKVSQTRSERYYSCCAESYPDITVNMTLTRISTSYKSIIVTPAFVVIILTMLSFGLPPQAGEKIILNACTALIVCLFTLYFTQKLPLMGAETPLIVMFYTSSLYIITFSMVGSVIVITLSRIRHSTSLPWVIKQPLTGKFGKLLRLDNYIDQTLTQNHGVMVEEMREHQGSEFDDGNSDDNHIIKSHLHQNKPNLQKDWILLAAAIDRISFVFYCLLFIVLSIVYSL